MKYILWLGNSGSRKARLKKFPIDFFNEIVNKFISFDEKSFSRLILDAFSISSRLFLDCFSMTSRCRLEVSSMKARLNNSDFIQKFISAIPMGYYKMVPQYLPRAPDRGIHSGNLLQNMIY